MSGISKGWGRQVAALGVTQILGFGAIFYAYPLLAGAVAREFEVAESWLYAAFSAGLMLGGMVAIRAGHWLDIFGAPRVMALGSAVVAVLFAAMAVAPSFVIFAALVVALQAISFLVLYDAAFAALALGVPVGTRKAITRLTLIAGFASTLFWPMTGALVEGIGWRSTCLMFAALHLLVALPLHVWLARLARDARNAVTQAPATAPPAVGPELEGAVARRAFWILGASFALTGFVIAALGVHLVPNLIALGLGQSAYLVGMLVGPAQVAVRIVDATVWRNLHPLVVAMISSSAIVLAMGALLLAPFGLAFAMVFAVLYGAGNGLASIVRGAVPLALFGARGIGRRLGHLAALRNMTAAAAPLIYALSAEGMGLGRTVLIALGIALLGLVLLLRLQGLMRHAAMRAPDKQDTDEP